MTIEGFLFGVVMYFLGGLSLALYASRKGWLRVSSQVDDDGEIREAVQPITPQQAKEFAALFSENAQKLDKIMSDQPFSVTGAPIRVPWHIRRKELEAAAKTKRKKFESFQEYV